MPILVETVAIQEALMIITNYLAQNFAAICVSEMSAEVSRITNASPPNVQNEIDLTRIA